MVKISIISFLFAVFSTVTISSGNKVPTVYDVLQLVYQVCSTSEYHQQEGLSCVSSHLGKEVVSVLEVCMAEPNQNYSVKEFCEQMTRVPEWVSKHSNPPQQLTKVMGLAALGRMACVLGEVQRPLPMWQAAFSKCFPNYQLTSLRKDSTRNRNENSVDPE